MGKVMRCHRSFAGLLAVSLCACPSGARAEVFRCLVGGRAVYQDLPCDQVAPVEPYRAPLAPAVPASPRDETPTTATEGGPGDLRALHRQIQAAVADERGLQADYAAALEAQREKARHQTNAAAEAEVRALDALWQRKRLVAEQRRQSLLNELRRRCPGGASLGDQKLVCQ